MRRDAEWHSADCFDEQRSVRGAIGEMHMNVIDAFALKKIDKKQRVARPQGGFVFGSIFLLVRRD